ncbi:Protein ZBED8 [Oopsacas minuta]|uniref:Protein ZBED8 n=1 Tax=Oopsacas minuta TaxID=111878 RepID=A0AAV7K9Z5_9METZ|nr:Protein ZBED8 [Oopsacas minuta]
METTTKAVDVLAVVSKLFEENNLAWDRLVGVYTDGAPAMLGARSGFVTKIKQKSPSVIGTHYVIIREALAALTLPNRAYEFTQFCDQGSELTNIDNRGSLLESALDTPTHNAQDVSISSI